MVEGYLGLPGSGKSFTMVRAAYKARKRRPHLRVYSNMYVDLPGDGEFIKLESWEQLLDAHDGLVLLDEINLWMPSRAWAKLPGPLLWKWAQVRKSGLDILWTAQHQARVDKLVRELTFMLYQMFTWRKLGFFVGKAYIGEVKKEFFASWLFVPFDISIARRYDTYEEVSLPEYLRGALSKDMDALKGSGVEKKAAKWVAMMQLEDDLREFASSAVAGTSQGREQLALLVARHAAMLEEVRRGS